MHGAYTEQFWFYAAAFALASLASISRAARDADCESLIRGLGTCTASGFFSVGVIATWCGYAGGSTHSHWYFLGIATLIGLMGSSQQDRYLRQILSRLLKAVGEKNKTDDE